MKIYIVIPAYNEAKTIGSILDDIKSTHLPVVVVDDGSNDQTFEIAKGHKVIVLKHKINLGKGAAIKTGCEAAIKLGAEAIIMMDSDGQHKSADIYKFIEKINQRKYDVIFGSRNLNLGIPLVRFMGNKVASMIVSLLFSVYVSDLLCGFRAFTTKAYRKMGLESCGYGIETEMVVKTGLLRLRHCEVSVETVYYDKFKGVTILDALSILGNVIKWRIFK